MIAEPIDRRWLLASAAAAGLAGGAARSRPAAAKTLRFPKGFVWGTATASYQVEGRGGGRADCIWDSFARQPGRIEDGSNGDIACDDYHRYAEDIALMAQAGLNAYRFSIAWPRVMPAGTGRPDPRGLDYYSQLTDALLKAGIAPWVCLYHWDLPQALQDRGGWTNRAIADWYTDYAVAVARRLGDRVTHWVMFNEAAVTAVMGYGTGGFAPGVHSLEAMWQATHHQNLAQGRGLSALRAEGGSRFSLGTVLAMSPMRPADGLAANRAAAQMWDAAWNRAFLDPLLRGHYPERIAAHLAPLQQPKDMAEIHQPVDFIGVNYYSRSYMRADPAGLLGTNWATPPAGSPTTLMGWPVEPQGLVELMADLRDNYGNPRAYITENGAAFADAVAADGRVEDPQRIAYLRDHIAACHRAIRAGCNLHGYFVWTIADNWEWTRGFTRPFGLVHIDRASLKRTPKASYHWYARVARANALA